MQALNCRRRSPRISGVSIVASCFRPLFQGMFASLKRRATASLLFIMISDREALKLTVNLQRRFWPMTKRPLGRGLSALISTDSPPVGTDEIRDIEIDLIRPGHQQPRTSFDQAKLDELAQSIRTSGIIQPLLVRPQGGVYELVAGERRWRAAQLAGLSRVPAIIREIPDDRLLELALIENIQRQELNPIEEANAYKRLIESLNLTQDDVARRIGRDRSFITNYLRILKLPSEIQRLLENEKLSFGHARALLGLGDLILQRRYAQKIVKHNWSVRETERRIKHAPGAKLRRHLGTQVQIIPARADSAGKIEIEYYSALDLDRLYSLIISDRETEVLTTATASPGL